MIKDVFAVIADPTRRQILQALAGGARPVGELVDELGISQPTVSKHLKVLRNIGLVESTAVGQKRFYELTPDPLTEISVWVDSLKNAAADDASEETVSVISEEVTAEKALTEPDATASEISAEETGDLPAEDSEDSTVFAMGEEGELQAKNQAQVAHRALDFTPMEEFIPTIQLGESSDVTSSIDITSLTFVAAEEADTKLNLAEADDEISAPEETAGEADDFDAVEVHEDAFEDSANSIETDKSNDEADSDAKLPEGYVAYTGEVEEPEYEDDTPEEIAVDAADEATTDISTYASVNSHTEESQEARGFLASLTRWGRRRSR